MKKLPLIILLTATSAFAKDFEPVTEIDGIEVRRATLAADAREYDATPPNVNTNQASNLEIIESYSSPTPVEDPEAGAKAIGLIGSYFLILLGMYFLPWLCAIMRGHHNTTAILVLNFFLGWTFIGWVIALVWSATAVRRA